VEVLVLVPARGLMREKGNFGVFGMAGIIRDMVGRKR
jgi:hypothetical protein